MACGYAWRFFNPAGLDRHRVRHGLSVAIVHFFLPALAFHLLATARFDRSFIVIPLTALFVTLGSLGFVFVLYRTTPLLRQISRSSAGVLILAASFGNVTYLGLPVINQMMGHEYGYMAILYDLLATTPVLLSLGVLIAARYGSGASVSFSHSLKRVLRLPPLWGVAAGVTVNSAAIPLPLPVLDAASLMGRAVIPVMIFTVGLALDFRDVKRLPAAVPALAIKLFVSPLLAWFVGSRLGLSSEALKAVTIEGAMPVMVLSLVIADEFDLDVPLAAACIAASTIGVFFTLPVMMNILF